MTGRVMTVHIGIVEQTFTRGGSISGVRNGTIGTVKTGSVS